MLRIAIQGGCDGDDGSHQPVTAVRIGRLDMQPQESLVVRGPHWTESPI